MADTLVNLEPMPDHIPELVPFPSLTGPQLGSNEDIASNLIADCVLPLPPTPISSDDGDCYQEIPSSKITTRVPRDGDVVEIKTNASKPKHRMTSILSEEESSDGWVENVVISQSMIESSDESKIKSKHVILQSEEESSEELVENVVLSQSMIRSSDKKKILSKHGIPQNNNYRIPSSKNENKLSDQTCDKCIKALDSIGVSFLKMVSNNLKSELPFSSETNQIILNCTKCANFPTLFIKSKNIFRKLGHRGGEEEIPYLLCRECKRVCTSTEIFLEGFQFMSTKFQAPDFDPSNIGKQRFIYKG